MRPHERKVVRLDLAVGLSSVTTGLLVAAGIGVGVASNRFLFGVVRDVPEARIRRERAA